MSCLGLMFQTFEPVSADTKWSLEWFMFLLLCLFGFLL